MNKYGINSQLTHGEARNRNRTPEYRAFTAAKSRCECVTNAKYARYGGRGIKFRFESYGDFLRAIGRRPSAELSLDRIDNDGHYEPGNIRWATRSEQSRNQRHENKRPPWKRERSVFLSLNGRTQDLVSWCEELNLPIDRIRFRRRSGWCDTCVLTCPSAQGQKSRCDHVSAN